MFCLTCLCESWTEFVGNKQMTSENQEQLSDGEFHNHEQVVNSSTNQQLIKK